MRQALILNQDDLLTDMREEVAKSGTVRDIIVHLNIPVTAALYTHDLVLFLRPNGEQVVVYDRKAERDSDVLNLRLANSVYLAFVRSTTVIPLAKDITHVVMDGDAMKELHDQLDAGETTLTLELEVSPPRLKMALRGER
jgi:hypothetical protein